MRRFSFFVVLASVFVLTGCVSREDADAKLAKGCEAAANAFLDSSFQIKAVKNKAFKDSPGGGGIRIVTLSVLESDGWANIDKEYVCTFREDFTFGHLGHTALIYQFTDGQRILGQDGYTILGTIEDQKKLVDAVEKAMR